MLTTDRETLTVQDARTKMSHAQIHAIYVVIIVCDNSIKHQKKINVC